jgi:hypothetical protein
MRGHHVRAPPKNVVRPLDLQLRQRTNARQLLSRAVPMADQIIEMRQKMSKSARGPEAA